MTGSPDAFKSLCDTIALLYHESRNVRHLVSRGLLDQEPWRFVVSLPTNRDDAWRAIAAVRDKARQSTSVESALLVFETRFHVSMHDLADVFANENWRHAKLYGGNAWAGIAQLALQLTAALQSDNIAKGEEIATQLQNARHNTGTVAEKIARLEKVAHQRHAQPGA